MYASEMRPHGPIMEKTTDEEAFLPAEPIDLILSGRYNKVPFMAGYTDMEGMLFEIMAARSGSSRITQDFELFVPHPLRFPKGSPGSKQVAQKIKKFYFGDEDMTLENAEKDFIVRLSDLIFFLNLFNDSSIFIFLIH